MGASVPSSLSPPSLPPLPPRCTLSTVEGCHFSWTSSRTRTSWLTATPASNGRRHSREGLSLILLPLSPPPHTLFPAPYSCALLSVVKMLKLMLMSSAFACIIHVAHDVKRDAQSVSEERHRAATGLQNTLHQIIPVAEQRMKSVATHLAKQYCEKVCGRRVAPFHSSVCLFVYLCVCLFLSLVWLSICVSVSVCLSVCLCLFVYLCVCLLSVCLSVCLCLCVYLIVCLSGCPSVSKGEETDSTPLLSIPAADCSPAGCEGGHLPAADGVVHSQW